jgi:hypothetical protein
MRSKPKRPLKKLPETGETIVAGAVAAYSALAAPQSTSSLVAGIAAVLAMLPSAVSLGLGVALETRKRMAVTFWNKVVEQSNGKTAEEVAGILEANAENPFVYETVEESIKGLLNAVDPSVVPAIGTLAAFYLERKKRPDDFFRGMVRMLSEFSEQEYISFVALMRKVRGHRTTEEEVFLFSWTRNGRSTAEHQLPGDPKRKREYGTLGEFRGLLRIFRLLKMHGLGADMPTGGFTGRGGPNVVRIYTTMVNRICRYLL